MKKLKLILTVLILSLFVGQFSMTEKSKAAELWTYPSLTDEQNYIWGKIYEVCRDNWDTYGVLPSVCMTQAYIESTIGEHCAGSNNLWGIKSSSSASGWGNYATLEDGIIAYCEVINNGRYPEAPYCKEPNVQLRYILDGNYCVPEGDYYTTGLNIISTYDLTAYDDLMFEELDSQDEEKQQAAEKKKKAAQKKKQEKLKKEQEALLEKQRKAAEEKAKQEAEELKQATIQSEKSKQMLLLQSIQEKKKKIFGMQPTNFTLSDLITEYVLYRQSVQKVEELENGQQAVATSAPIETIAPTSTPVVFTPAN